MFFGVKKISYLYTDEEEGSLAGFVILQGETDGIRLAVKLNAAGKGERAGKGEQTEKGEWTGKEARGSLPLLVVCGSEKRELEAGKLLFHQKTGCFEIWFPGEDKGKGKLVRVGREAVRPEEIRSMQVLLPQGGHLIAELMAEKQKRPPKEEPSATGAERRQPSEGKTSAAGAEHKQPSEGEPSAAGAEHKQPSEGEPSAAGTEQKQEAEETAAGSEDIGKDRSLTAATKAAEEGGKETVRMAENNRAGSAPEGSRKVGSMAENNRAGNTVAADKQQVIREILLPDKWEQLKQRYRQLHPFGDERLYIAIEPADFVILRSDYQKLVNNSFLLHGFYNYRHLILGRDFRLGSSQERCFYLGVPGTYFEREKMVAVMFGFEGFESEGAVENGKFGYYMRQVEI